MNSPESANPIVERTNLPDIPAPEAADGALRQNAEIRNQDGATGEELSAWRDEVAARLSRYRSRRKPIPPRYPSLRLRFEPEKSAREMPLFSDENFDSGASRLDSRSYGGLALDPSTPAAPPAPQAEGPAAQSHDSAGSSSTTRLPFAHSGARIIEFPRCPTHEPPPSTDELAEPVIERPRILEAPEVASAPALGGITLETVQRKEIAKRPGIDFPLESAPLAHRVFASAIDWLVIVAATLLFALIFWKITAVRPPRLQVLGLAAGIPCLFWAAYQYLLIVYSGSTPGLRLAGLDVACFDGGRPNRERRRWRVLASYLSAASLAMGYAWLFLDEDALCWHDRITHTYLAPKMHQPRHSAKATKDTA
jgi:uncharacterized RDD family membrane protein YckC